MEAIINECQNIIPNSRIVICTPSIYSSFISEFIKNFVITDIGYYPCPNSHKLYRQSGAKEYIFLFCVSGQGVVQTDDGIFPMKENDVIIIPPNKPHCYGCNEEMPWELLWFHYTGRMAYQYEDMLRTIMGKPLNIDKPEKMKALIFEALSAMEQGLLEENMIYSSHTISYLLAYMAMQINQRNKTNIVSSNKYQQMALKYMRDNVNINLTLKDIAEHINISPSHLSLIFKDVMGCSPIEFFIKLKIQRACAMLRCEHKSVPEVATILGYKDHYYFSKVFKKVVNISPYEYSKQQKTKSYYEGDFDEIFK